VLKLGGGIRYARLNEEGYFVWRLLDGERTIADLSLAYFRRWGELGVDAVLQTVHCLRAGGFVEPIDVEPRLQQLADRRSPLQSAIACATRWTRRTFTLPDPDRALDLLYRRLLRLLYRAPAQVALLAVALVGVVLFARTLGAAGGGLATPGTLAVTSLAGLELQILLHELGHAITTKHFGREVHATGVGWYLFWPVAFVDTSDMWLEGKRRRMAVAAAGPYVNLVLSGFAECLLPFAPAGWRGHLVLFAASGYLLALANMNPLYELDGYYLLSDWLDVPNLRARALAFLGARASRTTDARLTRIYVGYGVAAVAYACLAAAFVVLGYRGLVQHVAGHLLTPPFAAGAGVALGAALGVLLLGNLWLALRGQPQ
jgi:putative peptide zinc metalloprotease protein